MHVPHTSPGGLVRPVQVLTAILRVLWLHSPLAHRILERRYSMLACFPPSGRIYKYLSTAAVPFDCSLWPQPQCEEREVERFPSLRGCVCSFVQLLPAGLASPKSETLLPSALPSASQVRPVPLSRLSAPLSRLSVPYCDHHYLYCGCCRRRCKCVSGRYVFRLRYGLTRTHQPRQQPSPASATPGTLMDLDPCPRALGASAFSFAAAKRVRALQGSL